MLKPYRLFMLTALLLAGAVVGACSSSDDATPANNTATSDVTLAGSMQVASTTAGVPGGRMLSSNPADYVLYCVTFTDPPQSGTGSFDSSGTFSVTLTDAAGLPIGCFINDATTNTAVTTITFQVGASGGLSDTSGSVALSGGAYTVTIAFDPASGVATVDVSNATQSPSAATFDPASLVGTWRMTCTDTDPAGPCVAMIGSTALDLYMDVIAATEGSATLYAMGVWRDRLTFIDLGATEGIEASIIPTEITDVRSLNTDVSGASATNPLTGFTSHAGYSPITNQMNGTDALAELSTLGVPYDHTFNDSRVGAGETDPCQAGALDFTDAQFRQCFLEYINFLRDTDPPVGFTDSIPRVDPVSYIDFAQNGTDGSSLIQFRGVQVGDSPDISARYALMDLQPVGDSGVAQDFYEDSYTRTDPGTGQPVNCQRAEELTIVMTLTSETSALGRFTSRRYDSCDGDDRFATFETTFSRP